MSIGQILFKYAASKVEISDKNIFLSFLFNIPLLLALLIYGLATIVWILVLRDAPLRLAYPIQAIAFFVVPICAYFFLSEPLKLNTFIGAGVITLGVIISLTP